MKKLLLCLSLLLPLPALAQTAPGNFGTVNGSAVIATGNTFQAILAAAVQPNRRRSLTIQNNNTADNCWISFGVGITAGNATKAKSVLLLPGGSFTRYYPYIPSDEIEATCATSASTIYVDTQ